MPALIAAADIGLSFILPSPCAIASSPTKVGEMLAMGIPVAANAGVGDMALVMTKPSAGVLLPDLTAASIDVALVITFDWVRSGEGRVSKSRWPSTMSALAPLEAGIEL